MRQLAETERLLVSKELYVSDQKEGVSYYYSKEGYLQSISLYVDGKKEGIEKEFNKDSMVVAIREFARGRTIYYEEINRYDRDKLKYGVWKDFHPMGKLLWSDHMLVENLTVT